MPFLSILLLAAVGSATAQEVPAPSNSLKRAISAFAAADRDGDGKLGIEEARSIPVSSEAFAAQDQDKDATWSRDEFLLFYRRRLAAADQKAAPDLEAEIARIGALQRVKLVEETKKLTTESSVRSTDAESVEKRLEKALADLQSRAADRKATRDDVQKLRNLVILSGRASPATMGDPRAAASRVGMLEALERIEKQTIAGQYVQDEFEALRTHAAARARAPMLGAPRGGRVPPVTGSVPSSTADAPPVTIPRSPSSPPSTGPADARRRATPPKVEPGAAAAPKPPPKPAPRPTPPERPAPNRP